MFLETLNLLLNCTWVLENKNGLGYSKKLRILYFDTEDFGCSLILLK